MSADGIVTDPLMGVDVAHLVGGTQGRPMAFYRCVPGGGGPIDDVVLRAVDSGHLDCLVASGIYAA